jgi:sugar O-acyltransferase (sialic acid O-acetyltransferase NeuD family)
MYHQKGLIMNNSKLAIFGSGGHGMVVADAAASMGYRDIDFYDDNFEKINFNDNNINVIGNLNLLIQRKNLYEGIFVALGDNLARSKIINHLKTENVKITTIIHSSAVIASSVRLGEGVVILAGAIINYGASVGSYSIINVNTSIDHHCSVGKFCHISPGNSISGNVSIGDYSWLGVGTSVINNIEIGSNAIIGGGSIIINNIPSRTTAYGNPAKVKSLYE